jgi:uncharacterized RDD family membrane protein YckC
MTTTRTNTLRIQTPEGIFFSLQLAGPIPRFMAWTIDAASISVIASVSSVLLNFLGIISRDLAAAAAVLAYFLVSIGYGILTEWYWQGQTIGKRLLRLRVMDVQGLRLRFSQVVIRNLLRFVDTLPVFYMVGGLACLISTRAQRLGDFAANTIVVWNPRISAPDLNQLLEGKYNSFHDYPHLEARLRQRVSPARAGIALQAVLRRDDLDPLARTDGISDEQYVRNVVDVLFRPKVSKLYTAS